MTNDYSVGLYDESVNDIYHSAYGALTEAFEKFVLPALDVIQSKNLKVLDICYGIGYNTKALIESCVDKDISLEVDCVDIDKILIELSPFISTNISFWKRMFQKKDLYKNLLNYSEAKRIINYQVFRQNKYKISNFTNFVILNNLINNFGIDFLSDKSKNLLSKKENFVFFDEDMIKLHKFLAKEGVYLDLNKNKSTFVHNIYYKYVSNRFKIDNYNKVLDKYNIKFYNVDIRSFIKDSDKLYDIVFLDGFTPAKCPCIWSLEFFTELYKHLSDDGVIVTYNMSVPVRSAMKLSGLNIGDIINTSLRKIGTIASKNERLIYNNLSERQEGLLKTKAGIPYRDKNLTCQNEAIISARKLELENSGLISASQYLKN